MFVLLKVKLFFNKVSVDGVEIFEYVVMLEV